MLCHSFIRSKPREVDFLFRVKFVGFFFVCGPEGTPWRICGHTNDEGCSAARLHQVSRRALVMAVLPRIADVDAESESESRVAAAWRGLQVQVSWCDHFLVFPNRLGGG